MKWDIRYWIFSKLASYVLNWFAGRNDNRITKDFSKFVTQTLDKSAPTNLQAWMTLEKEFKKRKEEK